MSTHKDGLVIIVVQWARIKDFNGVRQVTNSFYTTRVLLNSDLPLFNEFIETLNPDGMMTPNSTASSADISFLGTSMIQVNNLYDQIDQTICSITASVLKVETDVGWYYEPC